MVTSNKPLVSGYSSPSSSAYFSPVDSKQLQSKELLYSPVRPYTQSIDLVKTGTPTVMGQTTSVFKTTPTYFTPSSPIQASMVRTSSKPIVSSFIPKPVQTFYKKLDTKLGGMLPGGVPRTSSKPLTSDSRMLSSQVRSYTPVRDDSSVMRQDNRINVSKVKERGIQVLSNIRGRLQDLKIKSQEDRQQDKIYNIVEDARLFREQSAIKSLLSTADKSSKPSTPLVSGTTMKKEPFFMMPYSKYTPLTPIVSGTSSIPAHTNASATELAMFNARANKYKQNIKTFRTSPEEGKRLEIERDKLVAKIVARHPGVDVDTVVASLNKSDNVPSNIIELSQILQPQIGEKEMSSQNFSAVMSSQKRLSPEELNQVRIESNIERLQPRVDTEIKLWSDNVALNREKRRISTELKAILEPSNAAINDLNTKGISLAGELQNYNKAIEEYNLEFAKGTDMSTYEGLMPTITHEEALKKHSKLEDLNKFAITKEQEAKNYVKEYEESMQELEQADKLKLAGSYYKKQFEDAKGFKQNVKALGGVAGVYVAKVPEAVGEFLAAAPVRELKEDIKTKDWKEIAKTTFVRPGGYLGKGIYDPSEKVKGEKWYEGVNWKAVEGAVDTALIAYAPVKGAIKGAHIVGKEALKQTGREAGKQTIKQVGKKGTKMALKAGLSTAVGGLIVAPEIYQVAKGTETPKGAIADIVGTSAKIGTVIALGMATNTLINRPQYPQVTDVQRRIYVDKAKQSSTTVEKGKFLGPKGENLRYETRATIPKGSTKGTYILRVKDSQGTLLKTHKGKIEVETQMRTSISPESGKEIPGIYDYIARMKVKPKGIRVPTTEAQKGQITQTNVRTLGKGKGASATEIMQYKGALRGPGGSYVTSGRGVIPTRIQGGIPKAVKGTGAQFKGGHEGLPAGKAIVTKPSQVIQKPAMSQLKYPTYKYKAIKTGLQTAKKTKDVAKATGDITKRMLTQRKGELAFQSESGGRGDMYGTNFRGGTDFKGVTGGTGGTTRVKSTTIQPDMYFKPEVTTVGGIGPKVSVLPPTIPLGKLAIQQSTSLPFAAYLPMGLTQAGYEVVSSAKPLTASTATPQSIVESLGASVSKPAAKTELISQPKVIESVVTVPSTAVGVGVGVGTSSGISPRATYIYQFPSMPSISPAITGGLISTPKITGFPFGLGGGMPKGVLRRYKGKRGMDEWTVVNPIRDLGKEFLDKQRLKGMTTLTGGWAGGTQNSIDKMLGTTQNGNKIKQMTGL